MAKTATFTSYIRSEIDPSASAAYKQLEQIASASFANITRSAQAASRAAASSLTTASGPTGGTNNEVARTFDAIAASQRRLSGAANDNVTSFRTHANALSQADAAGKGLSGTLNTLATTLNVVQGPLGPASGRVRALSGALTELTGLRFGLAAVGATIFAFGAAADQFSQVRNRLVPLFNSQQQVNGALRDVVKIAEDSRNPLNAVVDLYARLTTAGRAYGLSQSTVGRTTETITKAVSLGGGPQQTRDAALFQISQGIGAGRLQGNDLRAVLEDSLPLAQALADGLSKVKGFAGTTVGDLRNLGEQGKLTTQVVVEALANASAEIDQKFAKLPVTISQGATKLRTEFQVLIGNIDQSTGATRSFGTVLVSVADNLRSIISLAAGVGAAFAAPKLVGFVGDQLNALDTHFAARKQSANLANDVALGPIQPSTTINARTLGEVAQTSESAANDLANAQVRQVNAKQYAATLREQLSLGQGLVANGEQLTQEDAARITVLDRQISSMRGLVAVEDQEQAAQANALTAARQRIDALQQELTAVNEVAGARAAAAEAQALQDVRAAKQGVTSARYDVGAASQRVSAATIAGSTAADDTSLTRATRARTVATALRQQEVAEADLAAAQVKVAESEATLTAAEERLTATRAAGRTQTTEQIAAVEALTVALEQEAVAADALKLAQSSGTASQTANQNAAAGFAFLAAAQDRARASRVLLTAADEAAVVAETEVTVAAKTSTAASAALAVAEGAAAAASSLLTGAFNLLKVSLPLIAITGLVTVVTYLATAESTAARAARELSDSQSSLGQFVDLTTGKIKEQNKALLANQIAAQQKTVTDTKQAALSNLARLQGAAADTQTVTNTGSGGVAVTSTIRSSLPSTLRDQIRAYTTQDANGEYTGINAASTRNIQQQLDQLGDGAKEARDAFTAFVGSLQGFSQGRAGLRLLTGQGRAGDARVAQGDYSGGASQRTQTFQKTTEQLNAEAATSAAQSDVERARAKLETDKAAFAAARTNAAHGGEAPDEAAYVQTIAADEQALKSATAAQKQLNQERARGVTIAKENAEGAAARTRDEALLGLEQRKNTLTQTEYNAELVRIYQAYVAQRDAIQGTEGASNAATAVQLANAKKIAAQAEAAGQKLATIRDSTTEAPTARVKADEQERYLDSLARNGTVVNGAVEKTATNPLGTGVYTAAMAAADKANIETGLRKPFDQILRDADQERQVQMLTLQGRTSEATALRQKLSLQQQGTIISETDYQRLVENAQQEEHINSLLAARERITSTITGAVDDTRSAFETFLTDLPSKGATAATDLLSTLKQGFTRINTTQITEQIFAGADERVKALIEGRSSADVAIAGFTDGIDTAKSSLAGLATSFTSAAARFNSASPAASTTPAGGATSGGTVASDIGTSTASGFAATLPSILGGGDNGVTGTGAAATTASIAALATGGSVSSGLSRLLGGKSSVGTGTPSATSVYNTIGSTIGQNLDKLFGTTSLSKGGLTASEQVAAGGDGTITPSTASGFFTSLGSTLGTGLGGAATGDSVNSFLTPIASAIGLKTSKTGAELGGAAGALSGIPGGQYIGAAIGSIVGGLFKTTKKSSATVSVGSDGELETSDVTGTSSSRKDTASSEASTVISQLDQIASSLGGAVTSVQGVSIGTRKDKYVVDTTGSGKTKGSGTVKFDTQEEAIAYAVKTELERGVITGISAASEKILESGQDLSTAIEKATAIESITTKLKAITDPAGEAVDELNTQFATLISYLKEGGATAQQYADAEKLYNYERQEAIASAQTNATGTLDDEITALTSGSDSTLGKSTVYKNAQDALAPFIKQIQAGDLVDQSSFVTAVKNELAASTALNGKDSAYYSDYDNLLSLLQQARTNASGYSSTDTSQLAASPFDTDSTVAAAIASLSTTTTSATTSQTQTLSDGLDNVVDAVNNVATMLQSTNTASGASVIALLKGFTNAS